MNYYEILGLKTDCSKTEIKNAYRKLVREYHPDINPAGAEKFKKISKAYETLVDDEKRRQYDIINGIFKTEQNTVEKEETVADETFEKVKSHRVNDNFLSELLKNVFEKSKVNNVEPVDGDDINAEVTVTLADVLHGVSKTVNIMNMELCPRCQGRKFVNGNKCPVCNGSGQFSQYKKLVVKIPVNIKNGGKLRIKGEGKKGRFGGKNGDLYLKVNIEGNSRIQYDGKNIVYNVPITPYEAVLGGEISIPTFDGFVQLQLPQNTTSGQKFVLSGQGVKKGTKKSDIIVVVSIEIPKHLSDEEVKLYEKLRELSVDNIRKNMLDD